MTLPVDFDDLTQGAAKFLLSKQDVLDVLGYDEQAPWVFQDVLQVRIEGKSMLLADRATAVVVSNRGSWTAPNNYNTAHFPRLALEIYADPLRDENRNAVEPAETRKRIAFVHRVIDVYLHRPYGFSEYWGGVRVHSSVRQDEVTMYPVGDGDGMLRGLSYYALTTD